MPVANNVKVSPFSESGMTGLVYSNAGSVDEEFLPNLLGRQAIRVYKEMRDNDPMIGAILFCIDMLLRSVTWKAEQNPNAQDPVGDAEFLQQCMEDMSHTWPDFVSEIMTMLPFGWSWFEVVYKRRNGPQSEDDLNAPAGSLYTDGKVGWRKFAIRSQESLDHWSFDDNGGVQAMVQRAAPLFEEVTIPIQKSLLFRTTTLKNNPEGRSIFRNAYRPWFYKQRMEVIEGIGVERDLAGLPIAYVDPQIMKASATAEDKALLGTITRIIQNIKRDKSEGVVWPMAYDPVTGNKTFDLQLLSAGGSRQFDTNSIIGRYTNAIAMTVMADFIMLGHEVVGSFALSSDKTDLFAIAMGTFLDGIAGVINRFAVSRLWALNGMDTTTLPKIIHGDLSTPDIAEVAAYILQLVQAGMPMFPDQQLENHLRQIAHLPEVQGEEGELYPEEDDTPANPVDTSKPVRLQPPNPPQPLATPMPANNSGQSTSLPTALSTT